MTIFSLLSTSLLASEANGKLTPVESLMPMLGGLLLILVIIFGLAFVFKRFSNFSPNSKNIKIVETQMIGTKEKLLIVKVQKQTFLVGVTPHSINQLGELDLTEEVDLTTPSNGHATQSFSSVLTSIVKGSVGIKDIADDRKSIGKTV